MTAARNRGWSCAFLVSAVLAVAWPQRAHAAAPTIEDCLTASEGSIALRKQHRLHEARARLLVCSDAACPGDIRDECVRQVGEINVAMPTIILEAKSTSDSDLTQVRVTMDGHVLANRLDGTAIALDPGEHAFTFETAGQPAVTQSFVVREGQKNRLVSVRLGPEKAVVPAAKQAGPREPEPTEKTPERTEGETIRTTSGPWWVRMSGGYVFQGDDGNHPGALASVGLDRGLALSPRWQLLIGANAIGGRVVLQDYPCTTTPPGQPCIIRRSVAGGYLSTVMQVTPAGPRTPWFLAAGVGVGVVRFGSSWSHTTVDYDVPARTQMLVQGLLGTGVLVGETGSWGISADATVGPAQMAVLGSLRFSL